MIEITIDRDRNNANSDKECRICFDTEMDGNKLIYPCLCSGTSKYVHELCLRRWRMDNFPNTPYNKCMECRFEYLIDSEYPLERKLYTSISLVKIAFLYVAINLLLNIFLYYDRGLKSVDFFLSDYNPHNYTDPDLYINSSLIHRYNVTSGWLLKRLILENDIYWCIYNLFFSCYLVNNCEQIVYFLYFCLNINRKKLFVKLDYRNEFYYFMHNCYFIIFLNLFVHTNHHFWFFILCLFFPIFYCLNYYIVNKLRNNVIDDINIKYNSEKVLNYER